jgi:hypothetical protein
MSHPPLIYGFDRLHQNNFLPPSLPLISRNQAYYFYLSPTGILYINVSSHKAPCNKIWSSNGVLNGIARGVIREKEKNKNTIAIGIEEEEKTPENKEEEDFSCGLDEEGILKVISPNGEVVWKSREYRRGNGPFQAIMQDDGNLVIYDGEGEEIWMAGNEERE